jgi:hypothetical protein
MALPTANLRFIHMLLSFFTVGTDLNLTGEKEKRAF